MQHRVANSLQIIASILLLKARTVQSEEIRLHLHDAHQRVMSVATVQQQLQASGLNESIEIGPYLSKLCDSLAKSMVGDRRPISIKVQATSRQGDIQRSCEPWVDCDGTRDQRVEACVPEYSEKGEILVKYDGRGIWLAPLGIGQWRGVWGSRCGGSYRTGHKHYWSTGTATQRQG